MIKAFKSMNSGFRETLPIAPESRAGMNWVTVFIAENGGRKSFLLRLLTEAALGRRRYTPSRGTHVYLPPLDQCPKRVIAISGTPLDRFPRTGTRDLKTKRRAESYEDDFIYLGQRASNGMSGVAQSERSLVGSLISNRYRLRDRARELEKVFLHLGLRPYVSVRLRLSDRFSGGIEFASKEIFELQKFFELSNTDSSEADELQRAFNSFRQPATFAKVDEVLEKLKTPLSLITITPDRTYPRRGTLSVAMWELLMRVGAVEVDGTVFQRTGAAAATVAGEQLSSGQWNWLGSFGALVAELRNATLILVDEPENSLHPSWQRAFMPELQNLLRGVENCQVVVATHSPLIASSVSPEWGNIRTLRKASREGALVRSDALKTAFGWDASDVYDELFSMETTRASSFLQTANKALSRISSGAEISDSERNSWALMLRDDMKALPSFDPLRDVMTGIISNLSVPSRGRKNK